jgi:hypothetical protein
MIYYKFEERKDGIGGNIKWFILQYYYCYINNYKLFNITFDKHVNRDIKDFLNFDKLNEKMNKDLENKIIYFNNNIISNSFYINGYIKSNLKDKINQYINYKPYDKTLNYKNKINVGVHIRRGDIYYRTIDDSQFRDKYYKNTFKSSKRVDLKRRFLNNNYFINAMKTINNLFGSDNIIFHIFSTGEEDEFDDLKVIDNKILYISDPDHQEKYINQRDGSIPIRELISTMVNSDILICSKSNLSFSCALLTNNLVIMPKWLIHSTYWIYLRDLNKELPKKKEEILKKLKDRL